jgi:glycosidase
MNKSKSVVMEFHVSRLSRDYYDFDDVLFSLSGKVIIANFHAARVFAQKMNDKRDLVRFPERVVRAGQINAMGLIEEILHLVISIYREEYGDLVLSEALEWLSGMLGKEAVEKTLRDFLNEFPPVPVYKRELSIDEYLAGTTDGRTHQEIALEEMLMLWLANENLAYAPFHELFDDSRLDKKSAYEKIIHLMHAFFETKPPFGPDDQNLIDMLRSPALAEPHSLSGQLEYILQRWGFLLGKYLYRLLSSLDLIKEEEKAIFLGPGPSRVYDFRGLEIERERFSPDKEWMPSLVLLAKNAYVWLDQLSKQYQQNIHRLDQIPEEELDRLANWGFSGLWLIGLWERSEASKRIKQLRGNPEAVASAYSIYDYHIAADLGGDEAFNTLKMKAWQRGVRLASDMVPNHMGIDSPWVIDHPDWFISLDNSPFPSYTFNGPNLSWDERVGIFIEDHYFDNSDAAVVFKRIDFRNGDDKFIYHGNDGTSMPWNDTAQLNYLKPEVREAVIQTILDVARKFSIIRFDAAMTLAKKHYQRLWYPEPGSGGDIPSRAGQGITRAEFDQVMPVEFWREVVDRVTNEVPDTLLLAEAFWLMEGYFVRTLGMHRVYNSAFMNMLRDERNAEYRLVMKNTLEFDPEILKRYVNFMNNPDERTAVDQFGKGDKYFGICMMMSTLPGLPMYGHGQIQGFTEKYGMEYRRAYWDEQPDTHLIERHEKDIFPLLRKRYLFAEVHDFLLYDFFTPEGYVNEDVFAYSNKSGEERALIVYHNKYGSTKGWIRISVACSVKNASGERMLVQKHMAEGLSLESHGDIFTIFRDSISGLEYMRNNHELHEYGLYIELDAYKQHVFLDFRQVRDNEYRHYAQLAEYLNGRGVPNIDEALKEIFLQPILVPFRELMNPGFLRWVITNRWLDDQEPENIISVLDEVEDKSLNLLNEIKRATHSTTDVIVIALEIRKTLSSILEMPSWTSNEEDSQSDKELNEVYSYLRITEEQSPWKQGNPFVWGTTLGWLFTSYLGKVISLTGYEEISRSWIDEWLLGKIIATALGDMGLDEHTAWRAVSLIKLLTKHSNWYKRIPVQELDISIWLQDLLADNELQYYLGINRYQDVLWFNKESFDDYLWWMLVITIIELDPIEKEEASGEIFKVYRMIKSIKEAAKVSAYQLEKLLDETKGSKIS